MRLRDLVLDPWAPLSHKAPFARAGAVVPDGRSWLPRQDRRRLLAYELLKAYTSNVARAYIPESDTEDEDDRREYGDPALIVAQTVSGLLGEEQVVVVPDADGADDGELEDAPDSDETPERREQRLERNAELQAALDAAERQEWLRTWADEERLPLKLLETERNAVTTGDGVYLLAWNARRNRVTCTVVDPGFYFPVLPEGLTDEYPDRVYLAWELPGDDDRNVPRRLRRVTYELGPIEPVRTEQTLGDRVRRLLPGLDEPLELQPGDRQDRDGRIVRQYPWQADGETSSVTCYLTEQEWDLDDRATRGGLYNLDESAARYLTNADGDLLDRLDLRVDFLPVVHVPNTVALSDHYGVSTLSPVLQLLDELSSSDTDESAASATTGNPPIGVSGVQLATDGRGEPVRMTMGPGEVWGLGENGKLSTVDTSAALTALAGRIDRMLGRLSTNVRLPSSVLGRDSQQSPSGFHLLLTWGPYRSLVRELRLSRQEKYPLLLKFVQRLAMAGGALPPGVVYPADLAFGAYLPTDVASEVGNVVALHAAGLVSLETALRMLAEVGVPIDDVAAEVERIQARDVATANGLADLGDVDAAREYVGLEPAPSLVPPPLVLPDPPTVPPSTAPTLPPA